MRLSIVSPAPGYPGTTGVLAVYCRGLCRQTSLPAGNMYGVVAVARVQTSLPGGDHTGLAAVARAQTSRPGGDHVRGCGGGSMVFIWAGNLSRDLVTY